LSQQYHIASTRKLNAALVSEAKSKGIFIDDKDLLQIDLLDTPTLAQQIANNTLPLVFTSQYAVQAVHQLIQKHALTMATKQAYCIAGKTETLAREAGFELLDTANDANHLAQQLALAQSTKHLLHLSANIRLDGWKTFLQTHQIEVDTLEVYHKNVHPRQLQADDGVLFFSPSQVDAFWSFNSLEPTTPAFCIGQTTATHVAGLYHKNIQIASQANEQALLNTVYNYFNLL
jgi:uroporphyrinogen-III synthase